jgi:hypothetical protein
MSSDRIFSLMGFATKQPRSHDLALLGGFAAKRQRAMTPSKMVRVKIIVS